MGCSKLRLCGLTLLQDQLNSGRTYHSAHLLPAFMACTLCLFSWPSGSYKVLPAFQYYLQFCLLLCNVSKDWTNKDSCTCLFTRQIEDHLKHIAWRKVAMLLHKATVIFLNSSVAGKLQTSLSANETCGWCRSGVSPESCGVTGYWEDTYLGVGLFTFPRQLRISFL